MTDNEIIEALECCADSTIMSCAEKGCPFRKFCRGDTNALEKATLDLIKRQQAEIEQLRQLFVESDKEQDRLMAEIERLNAVSEICGDCHKKYAEKIQTAKSEAIKEFAEKLHELLKFYYPEQKFVHTHIDNLLKEMTE